MAVILRPWIFHLFFLLLLHTCRCQSNNQNIETSFPLSILSPPPPAIPSPHSNPPPAPPSIPNPLPAQPSPGSSKDNVAKAVAATAASTVAVTALAFLLVRRYVYVKGKKRRERDGNYVNNGSGRPRSSSSAVHHSDQMVGGDPKDLIVDENGLDVVYWRNLEAKSDDDVDYDRRKHGPIQEFPLLRGKSSASHVIVEPEPKPKPEPEPKLGPESKPEPEPVKQSSNVPLPPPPPPVPARSPPLPPPPKAKGRSLNSTAKPKPEIKKAAENSSGTGQQVKLKPLHWDKVNMANADHSMVWDKINDGGSFRFDGDLMEALFGCVATNRSPKANSNNPNSVSSAAQTFILDTRKSQNIAIVLKSLSLTRQEILDALVEGKGLDSDSLEKLSRIAPTEEEQSKILDYEGDPTRLADAECFIFHMLRAVPSAFTRLKAMLFRSNYDSEIASLRDCIHTLELGSGELRTRGLFIKLLEAVLKAGNRMNAGTSRGNAQAFNLTALRKLSDVRSSDGKTTLLHFVVEEVVRSEGRRCVLSRRRSLSRSRSNSSGENFPTKEDRDKDYIMLGLPVVGGLSSEFSNVKKASAIDFDQFSSSCDKLEKGLAEIRQLLDQQIRKDEESGGEFVKEMSGFLDAAEEELRVVKEKQVKAMELVKKTTEYYQAGASRHKEAHPLQLFAIVKDFLVMVDQACVEIARNSQRKRSNPSSSGPGTDSSSRVSVKFPMLPENFMSRSSSSSGSDNDS